MSAGQLSRRSFLGAMGTLAGAALVPVARPASAQYSWFLRQNIAALSAQQLQSLARGVQVMKARPASDPTSWRFQANIHGTFDPPAPLFNQCQHGTIQFFSWHRGYLYFFERILRQASGDPCLSLPYWNWSTGAALPLPFRQPADATNSLFDPSRFINDGSLLPSSVVVDDLQQSLSYTDFAGSFASFSPSLENSPHGAVHVFTGGNMGSVATAANDPIFWLHHCNIDRVWDQWLNLNAGRANPTDSSFLDQQYSFADECGRTVTVKVRDILHSACLGYRYDDIPNPAVYQVAAMQPQARKAQPPARVIGTSLVGATTAELPADAKPIALTFERHTATVPLLETAEEALRSLDAAGARNATKIRLDIEGISFAALPDFTYGIYLNLPDAEPGRDEKRALHVGTINFFARGEKHDAQGIAHQHEGSATFTQTLDATPAVAHLRRTGKWNAKEVRVTLEPLAPIAPRGKEADRRRQPEESARKAELSFKRIVLSVVP